MTDRALELTHYMANGRPLDLDETMRVMQYIEQLWGFPVELKSMNGEAVYSTVALNEGVPSVSLFYKE
jgi:spore cortex formation protein SpoVR/YcgB (stage V sporulation)